MITTDALELGIDIGELDAAVVVTFPGTVASLRQMWGRAGRRGRGLAVYVAGEDALDQFFCRHPDEFLERPVEAAILDHESPLIYRRTCSAPPTRGRSRTRTPSSSGRAGRPTPSVARRAAQATLRRRSEAIARETLSSPRRRARLPRRGGVAALGLARELRDRRRLLRRAARLDRGRARTLDRPRGRDLPAPRALLRGRRARPRAPPRARGAVRGDWYTQPKSRPTRRSCACSTAARRSASSCPSAR